MVGYHVPGAEASGRRRNTCQCRARGQQQCGCGLRSVRTELACRTCGSSARTLRLHAAPAAESASLHYGPAAGVGWRKLAGGKCRHCLATMCSWNVPQPEPLPHAAAAAGPSWRRRRARPPARRPRRAAGLDQGRDGALLMPSAGAGLRRIRQYAAAPPAARVHGGVQGPLRTGRGRRTCVDALVSAL